jgi:hypothetical protein
LFLVEATMSKAETMAQCERDLELAEEALTAALVHHTMTRTEESQAQVRAANVNFVNAEFALYWARC